MGIANQLTTRNIGSSMVNCTNACAVTGKTDCVGGLAGNFTGDNSWMANCRNSGEVSGTSYVGGIVGSFNNTEATIPNCYNVESILASKQSGGIAGWNSAGSNGYYDTEPGLGSIAYCYSQTHTVSNVEPPVGSTDNYKQGALVGENFYTYSNGKNLPGVLTGCGTFATASGNITPVNDYVGEAQQTFFTNPYVSGTTTILVNALNSWARSPEGRAAGANFWVLDGNGNPAPVLTSDPGNVPDPEPPTPSDPGGSSDGGYTAYPVSQPSGSGATGGTQTGGSVTLSSDKAKAGDTVTAIPKPEKGYELTDLNVKNASGSLIQTVKNADGTFSFKMPSSAVTVNPSFSKIQYYHDVSGGAYFADAAWYLRKENIMKDTGETTFSGGEKLNRQQSWMIFSRVDGQAPPAWRRQRHGQFPPTCPTAATQAGLSPVSNWR